MGVGVDGRRVPSTGTMTDRSNGRSGSDGTVSVDLLVIGALTVATAAIIRYPVDTELPLRAALGIPFLVFAPGYAFVSALFPARELANGGISVVDRLTFALGTSIAIVAAIGVALNVSPWGIGPVSIVLSVGPVTLVLTALAVVRRRLLPPDDRFGIPLRSSIRAIRSPGIGSGSRADVALNAVLLVSLLVASVAAVYALPMLNQGERYTEMSILTENESGELVIDNYPQEVTRGEEATFYLGITNQERESVRYTVVAEIQRTDNATDGPQVLERREIDRFTVTLSDGEAWREQQTVRPELPGSDVQLTYYLYKGDAPDSPTRDNAYRTVNLRMNVTESDTPAADPGGGE